MSKRKPALSTQLRAAQADLAEVQKRLASAEDHLKWSDARVTKAESELAQVHAFLDAVPNPPERKTGEYGESASAMTRLSVFLVTRSGA